MATKAMAARMHEAGGPDVLRYEEVDIPDPGPGQVLLRHTAVGINYLDISFRRGTIPTGGLPATIGMEAAGVVEATGADVTDLKAGDRVSHCLVLGSYAERQVVAADRLIRLPDGISDETAAAATLQGLTAEYLLRSSYAVQPGDMVLVQAAAGGVGLLLCQWAKLLGATVIGTVGSDEKAVVATAHGCDHPIVYSREDFVERVKEITDNAGVEVVYDAVGKDTFDGGLDLPGATWAYRELRRCLGPGATTGHREAGAEIADTDPRLARRVYRRCGRHRASGRRSMGFGRGRPAQGRNQPSVTPWPTQPRRTPTSKDAERQGRPSCCRDPTSGQVFAHSVGRARVPMIRP